MGKVISVYTQQNFKEFILPSINNADYRIVLNKNDFQLAADVEVPLEVVEGDWKIKFSKDFRIYKGSKEYLGDALENDDILTVEMPDKSRISFIIKDVENTMNVFDKYVLDMKRPLTIGKSQSNIVNYDYQGLVSKDHAVISFENGRWIIQNLGKNGLYVNSRYVNDREDLHFGDYINIVGLHIVFLNNVLAVDTSNKGVAIKDELLQKYDIQYNKFMGEMEEIETKKKIFHRSPRTQTRLETEPVVIEEPPAPNQSKQQPLLMTIGPSFTMVLPMMLGSILTSYSSKTAGGSSSLMMYSGLIMSVSSALIGVCWALININYQKKKEKEEELHRFEAYSRYLLKKTDEVKEKYEKNTNLLNQRYLAPTECVTFDENSPRLWNRNINQQDFLVHRLGIGKLPFQVPIDIPKEKFKLWDDSLNEKPRMIYENYKTLYNVPIEVDLLKRNLIGVVGGRDKVGAIEVARLLSAQIAANNCYTDVKLAYIYDKESTADLNQWEFAKWFPHVWSEDKKIRFVASNKQEASDVLYELTKIFRHREENLKDLSRKEGIIKPHVVLFVSDAKILEGELIAKYVFEKDKNIGLTTVLLTERYENLPNACEYIIQNDGEFQGMYDIYEPEEKHLEIEFDCLEKEELEKFARKLANIEVQEVEQGGEIPQSLTFLDMFKVNRLEELRVLDRWRKNRTYDNIRGIIGEKAGGAPCYMDVHEKYHGPHGLVAGTTGSGKSETLQTYMLSLALNYSPDDIAYFIIDYKGGGMANLFEGLPHMVGQISNLSGNQVRRAMVSIKSENKRRQRVFTENGVNNINAYTKLFKNGEATLPVPHLFIIIDEFAELKREEPDFMHELISVAQVGRSLGVHLILATQKPSGTVDDNIWSNSKFRLCLRVQDKQDSMDMLHKPDAAYITQAGRCYLQVGNDEVYELFQSGWSGAGYSEEVEVGRTDIAKLLTTTGRVEMAGSYAKISQKEKIELEWIRQLCKAIQEAEVKENLLAKDCLNAKSKMAALLAGVYAILKESGIEYANSSYNTARLMDFVRLYVRLDGEEDKYGRILRTAGKENIKLPQAKEKTQLDAVRDYLARIAKENNYKKSLQLWMPVLPGKMYLEEFEEYRKDAFEGKQWKKANEEWALDVLIGKVDDPNNQAQMPLTVSLSDNGNYAVIGSMLTGKSTFLQTMAYFLITKYTPDYVNIYALDFSSKMMSAFADAPHVGGVMFESDQEKIAKFFNMIENMLEERKKLFQGGNYSQYVQVKGVVLPAVVIFIDNFSAFQEKTAEKYYDTILKLSKEGVSHGIYMVIAAGGFGSNGIPGRVAENIKGIVTLELADKFAYADALHTMAIDVIPESGVKGRGLVPFGGRILEYQTALALPAPDDYSRLEAIRRSCEEMKQAWTGRKARRIPEIPEKPVWSEFVEMEDTQMAAAEKNLLPVAYNAENASVYSLDLSKLYCYLITGLARSGKKNYMKAMIQSAMLKDSEICIIDSKEKKLKIYEGNERVTYLHDSEQVHAWFLNELSPVFKSRNLKKRELVEKDFEEEEIYEVMSQEKPWFIFIPDFVAFHNLIYKEFDDTRGFMETLIKKGSLHNIYFIACMNTKERQELASRVVYEEFCNYKKGIHFGGNVAENSIFSFNNIAYRDQSKSCPPGVGLIANIETAGEVEKIVVPLVKRDSVKGE